MHPTLWILHEWWTEDEITENLRLRNNDGMNLQTIKTALANANHVVCVSEGQVRCLHTRSNYFTLLFVSRLLGKSIAHLNSFICRLLDPSSGRFTARIRRPQSSMSVYPHLIVMLLRGATMLLP